MLTGISGSKTVEIASTMRGFNSAVLSGSGTTLNAFDDGGSGAGSGIMGTGFMLIRGGSFRRNPWFTLERGLERMPGQAGAFHAHRELAYAREHRQLPEIFDRLVRRGRDDVVKAH